MNFFNLCCHSKSKKSLEYINDWIDTHSLAFNSLSTTVNSLQTWKDTLNNDIVKIQDLTEILVQLNNRVESLEKRIIPVRTFTVSEPYAEIENLDFLLENSYAVKLISNTPIEISIYAEFYNTSPDAEESYVGDSNSENIKLYPNIQQELDMSKLFAHVGNEIGVYHEIKNLRLDTYGDATVQYPIILEFYKK